MCRLRSRQLFDNTTRQSNVQGFFQTFFVKFFGLYGPRICPIPIVPEVSRVTWPIGFNYTPNKWVLQGVLRCIYFHRFSFKRGALPYSIFRIRLFTESRTKRKPDLSITIARGALNLTVAPVPSAKPAVEPSIVDTVPSGVIIRIR